jgi:hypothetical protein
MGMIKIDGQDYDFDSLTEVAKQQLQSLQFVDGELSRLAAQTAICRTARAAYAKALQEALAAPAPAPFSGDTIKLA